MEKPFGDIPDATSSNLNPSNHDFAISPSNLKPIGLEMQNDKSSPSFGFTGFCQSSPVTMHSNGITFYNGANGESSSSKSPFDKELQNNGSVDSEKMKHEYQTPSTDVNQAYTNLREDESLSSVFGNLTFKEGATVNDIPPGSLKYKNIPSYPSVQEAQYLNQMNSHPGSYPVGMMVPQLPNTLNGFYSTSPLYSSLESSNGLNRFEVETNGQEILNFLNEQKGFEQFIGDSVKQTQSLSMHSGAMPFRHHPEIHSLQVSPSNFLLPGAEYPVSAFEQRHLLDAQSPGCLQQQHLGRSQSHVAWQNMEDERHYKMHPQQYIYLQQLQNPGSEIHPLQASGTTPIQSMARNPRRLHLETTIRDQIEQAKQEPHWNSSGLPRGHSDFSLIKHDICPFHAPGYCRSGESCTFMHGREQTSGPGSFANDLRTVKASERGLEPNFLENMQTMSHKLNSMTSSRPILVGRSLSENWVSSTGRILSNRHCHHHSPAFTTGGSSQLDGGSNCGSSHEDTDFSIVAKCQPHKYNSVDEVAGRILFLATDQQGCRFLQKKCTEGTLEDVQKIFVEIIDHILELMTDKFGNYLVQKLLEVCNKDQQMKILWAVTRKGGDLIRISCDVHGTRAVQKVIETLKKPEQISMVVTSLKPGIVRLIKDANGNHVAQRCLQHLMPEYCEFLFNAVTVHCIELASDKHGCCVLQKCLLKSSNAEQSGRLLSEITSNSLVLSQDPFGNYAVQFVIDQAVPWALANILEQLEGNYGDLSMQKHSSNVVEKCIKYADDGQQIRIIQELINSPRFGQILQDRFGNYVIQSALANSEGAIHAVLVEAIQPHVMALQSSPYGRKVISSSRLKK